MEITEVRIKLMEEGGERLQAFCSITFDNCFVIRDLKIIEGSSGPFVAMPSRKLTSHCPQCGAKNHLRSAFCNDCGAKLNPNRAPLDEEGRAKLYADIAHPINSTCREMIQERVIREFREELERAKQPGYISRYDDFDIDDLVPQRHSRPRGGHPTTNYSRGRDNDRMGRPPANRSNRPYNKPPYQQPQYQPAAHQQQPTPAPVAATRVDGQHDGDGHSTDGRHVVDGHQSADGHITAEVHSEPAKPKSESDGFGDGIF